MKKIYRFLFLGVIVLVLISAPMSNLVQRVSAAPANCVDSSPVSAAYIVEVCITAPASGSTFTGNGTISATVAIQSGTDPGTQQVIFFLNSTTYLLTEFSRPFTFTLPTNRYLDGTYTLNAQALMRDGFTTSQVGISVTFSTGTINLPVNTNTFTPKTGNPANSQPFVVAVVGDGASGEVNTTNVTNLIASVNPNLFLYLGDVYEQGSIAEFYNWYGTSTFFDQFRSITDPTVGHHEYLNDPSASSYFYYWDNVPNYYSVNANGWHIISLNSHGAAGGTSSAEYIWLQADLAANPAACTIAYYHNPLYTIGNEAPDLSMTSIWQLLASNKASIVLNGNDHDYERWAPMNGNGVPSPAGITEFILGTGGHALEPVPNSDFRVAFWTNTYPTAYGVLFLTLNPTSADFSFQSSVGGTVLDSGTIPCVPKSTIIYHTYLPLIFK